MISNNKYIFIFFFLFASVNGFSVTDWDGVSTSITSFGLVAKYLPGYFLLALNVALYFWVVSKAQKNLYLLLLLCNPFVFIQVLDAYNKFSFILFFSIYLTMVSSKVLFGLVSVILMTVHPIGFITVAFMLFRKLNKWLVIFAILAAIPVASFILDFILVSKGMTFNFLFERVLNQNVQHELANSSIAYVEFSDLLYKILLSFIFPPVVFGFGFHSIAITLFLYISYLSVYKYTGIFVLVCLIALFTIYLLVNPNFGSLMRNFIPVISMMIYQVYQVYPVRR
jgi:hypothetical protein